MKLDELSLIPELYKKDPALLKEEYLKFKKQGIDFSTMYQELEMRSRFVDTHMDISFGDFPVNLHSHSYYEIMYVLSNSGTQYLAGTKRYSLQPGDIVIVPPGVGHKPLFPSELAEPYRRIVLWISVEFIKGVDYIISDELPSWNIQPFLLRTANTSYEYIGSLFHKGLKEAHEKKDGWQISLCGNTLQLLVECLRAYANPGNSQLKSEKPELLDEVVSYIESHLSEKITLADTASRFFVSESTIGQTFQKKMHVSFYHYVTQRRLIAAKTLMIKERNMDYISTSVGFSDYSAFYRAFKKEFGISPREYRNLIADDSSILI